MRRNELIDWYTIIFSHPSVEAITWWNLSDLGAWKGVATGCGAPTIKDVVVGKGENVVEVSL